MTDPRPALHVHDTGLASPAWNMAVDRALLESDRGPTLRLYGWRPSGLSLGHFQTLDPALEAHHRSAGHGIVRRLTGGGAIFHADELTYSLSGPDGVGPFAGPVDASYRRVHDVLLALFRDLGVEATYAEGAPRALSRREQPFLCFARSTALDLAVGSRKLVGSAKRRRGGRALQHGSIILRPHPENGEVAGLADLASSPIDREILGAAFARQLAAALGLEPRFEPLPAPIAARADLPTG
ncbi:MAG: lipoate--protein ligase [Planctomycetota bacterium]